MVMTLILILSKLVDIPKTADLWRNFYYATLLKYTSAWVISYKFAAFLQNTFSEEHLWRGASGHLHYNKKHKHIFLSIHWYKSNTYENKNQHLY